MKKQKIILPLVLVELEDSNYHIMIDTSFADGFKGMWIIDTGASKTVLDSNLENYFTPYETPLTEIESMGIGSSSIETKSGCIDTLFIGQGIINNLMVALIDLSQINLLYQKYTSYTITGLLGSDFLLEHNALIDFKKRLVQLSI